MGRKLGFGVAGLLILVISTWAAHVGGYREGFRVGQQAERESLLRAARQAKAISDSAFLAARAESARKAAESKRAKEAQQARDDERKRHWSDKVYNRVQSVYPRTLSGPPTEVAFRETQKIDDQDSWAFLISVKPSPDQRGSVSFLKAAIIERGRLRPELDDEEAFYWLTRPPEWIALYFARKTHDDVHLEVVEVTPTGPGALTAILRDRETAERYRITIKEFYDYETLPID